MLDDYIKDCQGGVDRWNKVIEKAGIAFRFAQPHKGFNRRIGEFGGKRISPAGDVLSEDEWQAQSGAWLPNDADMTFIDSLMLPATSAASTRAGLPRRASASTARPATSNM